MKGLFLKMSFIQSYEQGINERSLKKPSFFKSALLTPLLKNRRSDSKWENQYIKKTY